MPYIGKSIKSGTFSDLGFTGTFNSSTTDFNLGTQVGSPAQLIVSKNGVFKDQELTLLWPVVDLKFHLPQHLQVEIQSLL